MPWLREFCGKSWESNKYPTEWARKRPPGLLLSLVWVGPEKIVDSMWLQDFHLRWLGRYIFAPDPSAGRVSATLARSRMSTTCRIRVWDWNISEFLLRMSQGKKKAIIRFGSHSSIGTRSTISSMNKKQASARENSSKSLPDILQNRSQTWRRFLPRREHDVKHRPMRFQLPQKLDVEDHLGESKTH